MNQNKPGKILFLHTPKDRWRRRLEATSKIGSLLVVVIYAIFIIMWSAHDSEFVVNFFRFLLSQLVILALIWFPEEIGSYVGPIGRHPRSIDSPSPAILIAFMGWVLLLAPVWLPLVGLVSVPWVFKF